MMCIIIIIYYRCKFLLAKQKNVVNYNYLKSVIIYRIQNHHQTIIKSPSAAVNVEYQQVLLSPLVDSNEN